MSYCWFEISIDGAVCSERVFFRLFDDRVPKTCENFRQLCIGAGELEGTNATLSYKNSIFHRVIPSLLIQGGDITNADGRGGVSIYGATFDDEDLSWPADDRPGLLAMANSGPNTNGSQFFITLRPCKYLDGSHVVFGAVLRGMATVRRVAAVRTGAMDRPTAPCRVEQCGTTAADELPPYAPIDGDLDPDFPEDAVAPLRDGELREVAERIRVLGNRLFEQGNFGSAAEKYEKSLRYLNAVTPVSLLEGELREKKVACHSNRAMCQLKLGRWQEAVSHCKAALALIPNHIKSMYRQGLALLELQDFEEAERVFSAILAIDGNNTQAQEKLQETRDRSKRKKATYAARYKRMFS